MDMRMGPAPRAQRKAAEGPLALTARPSRNSGARIKGVYDIPVDQYVHTSNEGRKQPHWIDEPGGMFVTFGGRMYGTGSTTTGLEQFARGVTLWRLDEDDNPYPIDQVDAYPGLGAFDQIALGDYLGDGYSAGIQVNGRTHEVITRWYDGGLRIMTTPQFGLRAWRIVGESIQQSELILTQLFTHTEPPGLPGTPHEPFGPGNGTFYTLPTNPDFFTWLHRPMIAGLTEDNALMASFGDTIATHPSNGTYFVLWTFDPFNMSTTLLDTSYSGATILRQPEVVYNRSELGLLPSILDWRFTRRTDGEAVMVVQTYTTSYNVDGRVQIIRFNSAGAIIGNTIVPGTVMAYSTTPPALDMGAGTVISGGARITSSGVTDIELPTPFYEGFVDTQSYVYPVDVGESYLWVHLYRALNPDEMKFVTKDLSDDSTLRVVTSTADTDADAEVHAMSASIMRVLFGNVDTNLWVSARNPTAYNTRNQVVTIELGAGRQAGTAEVITEHNRFHRLPQGLS